jgi:hypothetical protein
VAGAAWGAGAPRHARPFTQIAVGAHVSTTGNRFEIVYRVKRSPDGGGAGVLDGVLIGTSYPAVVHDTTKAYYADGVQGTVDTYTMAVPHTNGVGTITGQGRCTTGSGSHKGETCSYKISGTYDLQTGVTKLRFSGTLTR